ncbi:MAG: hypothetical protein KDE27_19920 [Planctomycetes bacterium]|nr:hypothetical protein [Planctomycetota bacterium]
MQAFHLFGAAALCAGLGLFLSTAGGDGGSDPAATPPMQPPVNGHFVLVVEGDRDRLDITHASHKADPWAGIQKGLTSDWVLSIRDRSGAELQRVPLDMSKFDLDPRRKGGPIRVEGCIVRDAAVAMIANAPCVAGAASYVFLRGDDVVGTVTAARVDQLAGGGR